MAFLNSLNVIGARVDQSRFMASASCMLTSKQGSRGRVNNARASTWRVATPGGQRQQPRQRRRWRRRRASTTPAVSRGAVAGMLRMVDGGRSDRSTFFSGSESTPISHGDALLHKGVGDAWSRAKYIVAFHSILSTLSSSLSRRVRHRENFVLNFLLLSHCEDQINPESASVRWGNCDLRVAWSATQRCAECYPDVHQSGGKVWQSPITDSSIKPAGFTWQLCDIISFSFFFFLKHFFLN